MNSLLRMLGVWALMFCGMTLGAVQALKPDPHWLKDWGNYLVQNPVTEWSVLGACIFFGVIFLRAGLVERSNAPTSKPAENDGTV